MIKITYYGFCGKCATRLIGHACLFAEQGNRVRVPDMERICRAPQSVNLGLDGCRQNSENSCISKALFPCKENLRAVKTGHWKGCHGPERRLKQCVCAKKRTRSQRLQRFTRMNRSVRRPTNPETKNWQHSDSFLSAYLSIPLRSQEIQDTKAMVITIIVFLCKKILFILTGRCQQVTPPTGAKGSIDTREGSK